jgi:hypothetical protein
MRLAGFRACPSAVPIVLIAALLSVAGCTDVSQLQFQVDHKVKMLAPKDRAKTTLPVTVRWELDGFRVAGPHSGEPPSKDAGYFALFVDRAPIKPGQTLAAVAGDDSSCIVSQGCPDRQYLADRQVYVTTHLSYKLRRVFNISDNNDDWQLHDVTIVLLDTAGRRIGEHAYYRDFKLKRDSLA